MGIDNLRILPHVNNYFLRDCPLVILDALEYFVIPQIGIYNINRLKAGRR